MPVPEAPSDGAQAGRRRKSRVRPWLALALSVVSVIGALWAADRVGEPASPQAWARFVPADGAQWFGSQVRTGAGGAATTVTSTESALITGPAVVGALDGSLATAVIGALGSDAQVISTGRYWRTVTTQATPGTQQATRLYRLAGDLLLVAESGPSGGFAYRPNLLELPADVVPGRTWRSTGQVVGGTGGGFDATFRAAPATDPGCLSVTGTITYTALPSAPREVARTWCPGRGSVRTTDRWRGTTLVTLPNPAPDLDAPGTGDPGSRWAPLRWTPRSGSTTSVDPTYGPGEVGGSPAPVQPALTRLGALVRVNTSGQDLLAARPGQDGRWEVRWRAHPGGTVLSVAAFGDLVVATTSLRQVVGYDAAGVRRWVRRTDEVVQHPPVRASATELALVTLAGTVVVLDLATGRVRSQVGAGADVGVAPAGAAGLVVVADRSGEVAAFDVAAGTARWHSEVEDAQAVGVADQVLVLGNAAVEAFDAATGQPRWRAPVLGTARAVTVAGDRALVRTSDGVTAYDDRGRAVWRRRGVTDVSTDGRVLVLWGSRQAEVVDPGGRTLTRLALDERSLGDVPQHVATPDGVLLLGSTWDVTAWTS